MKPKNYEYIFFQQAQEEMAWRVAEMIIKDVTNLTMGSHLDEDDNT